MAGATITVRGANGASVTTTGADGSYSVTVTGLDFPAMLSASDGGITHYVWAHDFFGNKPLSRLFF